MFPLQAVWVAHATQQFMDFLGTDDSQEYTWKPSKVNFQEVHI